VGRLRRLEYGVVLTATLFVAFSLLIAVLVGGAEVLSAIRRVSAVTLLWLLALSLLNYALRVLRWHRLSRRLGVAVPLGRTLLYYVAGFSMTATPGRVGEALRLWMAKRAHGHRYDRMVPLLVADRLFDMLSIILLGLAGAAAFPQQRWIGVLILTTVMATTVALAWPGWILRLLLWTFGVFGRRFGRFLASLRRSIRGTARILQGPALMEAMVLSVIGWGAECLAFSMVLHAMGAPISPAAASFVFAIAAAIGGVTLLPGGMGGTEATMVALLSGLGVDLSTSIAATLVIRATTLWFSVALGFMTLPVALRLVGARAAEASA
jgi:uncharacterized protein (TIRG00374 family)